MTDVGDEVATDVFEAASLGDVLDDRQHPEGASPVVDHRRTDGEGAPGWPVDVDGPLSDPVGPSFGEHVGHRLGGDRFPITARHEVFGLGVAKDDAAALVTEHETEREGVEERRRRTDSALDSLTALCAAPVTSSR